MNSKNKKTEEIKDLYLFGMYIGKSNEKLTPIEVLKRYRRGNGENMPVVNYCNCDFAMVMRDVNTNEPYCAECGKLIEQLL